MGPWAFLERADFTFSLAGGAPEGIACVFPLYDI